MKKEDFTEHYKTLDLELLFKIANSQNNEYIDTAIEAAKHELVKRGFSDNEKEDYIKNYKSNLDEKSCQEHCNALENHQKLYSDEINEFVEDSFKKNIHFFKDEELAKIIVGKKSYFSIEIINAVKDELILRKKTQINIDSGSNDPRRIVFIFKCFKCNSYECTQGEVRVTGGIVGQLLNLQSEIFASLICNDCGYTEFYKVNHSKKLNTIIDLLIGI